MKESSSEEVISIVKSSPKIATTIELLDPQIRERCLDLFNTFHLEDQTHRLDIVITEATRILEDRIRRLSGADPNLDGLKLVAFAFGGTNPKLKLGTIQSEQDAAHQMFRGVFGFIRNPFHHRLIEKVEKERVLQILGMIDYWIYLTESAERSTNTDEVK